ncbi:MAG TPA: hypothetical protein VFZ47_03480 [Chitinophagaceae bacterium]
MKQKPGTRSSLKSITTIAALFLVLFTVSSCKKDKTSPPDVSVERYIVINFSNVTIPMAQVDSGTVILKRQGSNNPIFRRFDKASASLNLLMDDSPGGNWTADLYVYSKKQDGSVRLFTRSIGFSLPLVSNLDLIGPTGGNDGLWVE